MVLFISLAELSHSYATKKINSKGGNKCIKNLIFLFLEIQLYVLALSQVKDFIKT